MVEFKEGLENFLSFPAGGTIAGGDAVKLNSSGQAVICDTANEAALGIAMHDVVSGEPLAVAVVGAAIEGANVADAVAVNNLLTVQGTTNGRLDAAGVDGIVFGIALTDGDANNRGTVLITGPGGIQAQT